MTGIPVFVDNQAGNTFAKCINFHLSGLRIAGQSPNEICIATGYFNAAGWLKVAEEVERLKSVSSLFTDVKITKRDADKVIPLSFAQERLWFLDQLQPNNPFYNIPETYRIRGNIDLSILEKCINDIIKRHEILRTYFISVDGTPQQKIQDSLTINIPIIDLSNEPIVKKDSLSKKYIDIESKQSISIYNLPLFRIKILKLENDDHIFF